MNKQMIYQGGNLNVELDEDGVAELCFDAARGAVNKFDESTRAELRTAVDRLGSRDDVRGLLLTSARDAFVVGADITEFTRLFNAPEAEFEADMKRTHRLFADIEDLPFPTCAVIDGLALGGGFEVCLACDFRVMAEETAVGLPEIHLGIFPGWGGSIRLPRLIGVERAVDWIASGAPRKAKQAVADGAVDQTAPRARLVEVARKLLATGVDTVSLARRRRVKTGPLSTDAEWLAESFRDLESRYAGQLDPNCPALRIALDTMALHAPLVREAAIAVEIAGFIAASRTSAAASLVGLFLADQVLKRQAKRWAGDASPPARVGVVGAGIMGGGVALQCALKKIPVVLSDQSPAALHSALAGIATALDSRVEKGRLDDAGREAALARIETVPDVGGLRDVELVIEAVVEDVETKARVLAQIESEVSDRTVIATNTSTVSIDRLAGFLQDPARFEGVHFFNPVPVMPLVEVIRGSRSSDDAVARAVAFASALGKRPVVVRDCPGFLVNRVLFPYLLAFEALVRDGVDFERIDAVMEDWGWPMGPARLIDVVGIDTTVYAGGVMAEAYPDRMAPEFRTPTRAMFDAGRLGAKNGRGYFRYDGSTDGRPSPERDEEAHRIAASCAVGSFDLDDADIVARMMTPMCIELARCLEEDVVSSSEAADMALIWGLGFPRHVGGALRYVDHVGAAAFCDTAARFSDLGPAYRPCESLVRMAGRGERFFPID